MIYFNVEIYKICVIFNKKKDFSKIGNKLRNQQICVIDVCKNLYLLTIL